MLALWSWLPVSGTVRNKYVLVKPTSLWHFLIAAELTGTQDDSNPTELKRHRKQEIMNVVIPKAVLDSFLKTCFWTYRNKSLGGNIFHHNIDCYIWIWKKFDFVVQYNHNFPQILLQTTTFFFLFFMIFHSFQVACSVLYLHKRILIFRQTLEAFKSIFSVLFIWKSVNQQHILQCLLVLNKNLKILLIQFSM